MQGVSGVEGPLGKTGPGINVDPVVIPGGDALRWWAQATATSCMRGMSPVPIDIHIGHPPGPWRWHQAKKGQLRKM